MRECLVFVGFLALTALMTWPWVLHLRDAVADTGDSYAFAWTLWWDYHQTFHDPLNLFHANIFFPYRYTLAFTEHGYGVALFCFPLFAAGLRPLTVYSVATFCGFAFCGYGAFRLTRTLTGSSGAGLVAGIVFAFIPYRFIFLTALPYLCAAWLPLLLEALVLFARVRSRCRAVWLGVAFLMNGLTCINWFLLALVPFALSVAVLVIRYRTGRERAFWRRGLLALAAASVLLLPFMWPYYKASKLYGFKRDAAEVARNSAGMVDWLTATGYNKVWQGMGSGLPGVKATLFPGLLAPLLALAALLIVSRASCEPQADAPTADSPARKRWLNALDAFCVLAGSFAVVAAGLSRSQVGFFRGATTARALLVFTSALGARLCLSYPQVLRPAGANNLIASLRAERRDDAFWLGLIWTVTGFLCSFGMSFFFYRVLYDLALPFQSLRAPYRAAMTAYVGLAVLAGLGANKLAQLGARWRPFVKPATVYALLACALLFELHAAPLPLVHGAVLPDAVTLRLKETPMRGGVVDLPSLPEPPFYSYHLSMLRAADHGRPVVMAASSFIPPLTLKVHDLTGGPGIPPEFLDLLEEIPASYVVFHRGLTAPAREAEFETFFAAAVAADRLRLIGHYGDADLYAVVKTEPEAQADARD
ncbi:MAG: hypothetical protein DMF64_10385 [Acidobacteria bacterium]|nr:MAG: hypothetical protein DMF64_10385 [Acidobacteriota bacterium]